MNHNQREQLIAAAQQVREHAYAPYSGFQVGAAVLTSSGDIFTGCNVENASLGLTLCAERAAIVSAVAAGSRDFTAIAIATSGAAPPCGACRQCMSEFSDDLQVLLIDIDDEFVEELLLTDLLPRRFGSPEEA